MLIETLKILVHAGKNALYSTSGLPVTHEEITQVRHGQITFPSMGEVGLSGGTLQSVRLGCDAILCSQLAEKINSTGECSGFEILANSFLDFMIKEMAGRRPRGWVQNMEIGPISVHTRGIRSFGFRLQTEIGQFFMMAEVPSKVELERAKGNDYCNSMITTYLPRGWENLREFSQTSDMDNFLIFMRRTEVDIQVEVPAGDGLYSIHTGVMVERAMVGGRRAIRLVLDLSGTSEKALALGEKLRIRVGVKDRAITFSGEYLGEGNYPITEFASLKCINISIPREMKVEQMRRAFRIDTSERIPVEIECINPMTNDSPWFHGAPAKDKVRGRLADISFSGARIIAEPGRLMGGVNEDSRVVCRVYFPGESEPLRVLGTIKRATTSLADRDSQQDEVGLEFLVGDDNDRLALEWIRQYVLSQQRSWLSERIHVAGMQ